MTRIAKLRWWILPLTVLIPGSFARADVANGNFDTGNLTGWTSFLTPTGTVGAGYPVVTLFDTTGTGPSAAATFYAGLASGPYGTANYQGGGISQNVMLPLGVTTITLDFAAFNPHHDPLVGPQGEGGRFRILLDGLEVASHTIGTIQQLETIRGTLSGSAVITSAGSHELRLEVSRNYYMGVGSTPAEYIDNVEVVSASSTVPEPASVILLSTVAVAVLAASRRRVARR